MQNKPTHAVVWAEIPVSDMARSMAFYQALTGQPLTRDDTGPNPMANFAIEDMQTGVSGHLYPGKPARDGSGPTVHIAVSGTVEAAAVRCTDGGGKVLGPVIDIPPGRFQYAQDPDGNSIGLFETRG